LYLKECKKVSRKFENDVCIMELIEPKVTIVEKLEEIMLSTHLKT
jgi:hypothetical protein